MKDILVKYRCGFVAEWDYEAVLVSKQQTHYITLSTAIDPQYDLGK